MMKKINGGGIMDVIRCDEPDYLIWKWHPEGTEYNQNKKENGVRWGSSLRVKEGSVAVFIHYTKEGVSQDFIEGPFDSILKTNNLPVISGVLGLAYAGGSPFQAEVYFINLANIIQIKFGVPFFDVFDPRFTDFSVPVAVRGTMSFKITDYKEFIRLHRLDNFSIESFQGQIRDALVRYVKSVVANAPEEHGIPVVQLERKISEINDLVETNIKNRMAEEFGVTVSSVDIAAIELNKDSEGYRQLKTVTQDIQSAQLQAQSEVSIKDLKATQKLGVFEKVGRILTDVKEDQYARHKQTQAEYKGEYDKEVSAKAEQEAAKSLGKMGRGVHIGNKTVIGSIDEDKTPGVINKLFGSKKKDKDETPPPIPVVRYSVAVNGKQTGPFDMETLEKMADTGELTKNSLVWKKGLKEWVKAGEADELAELFIEAPPIPKE